MRYQPRPLVPEDRNGHLDDALLTSLARTALVLARGKCDPHFRGAEFAQRTWGTNEANSIAIISKAASTPASLSQTGWAAELAQLSQAFLRALVPASAGAALLQSGVQVEFGNSAALRLPVVAPGTCCGPTQRRLRPQPGRRIGRHKAIHLVTPSGQDGSAFTYFRCWHETDVPERSDDVRSSG